MNEAIYANQLTIEDIDNIMVFLNRAAKTGAEADVMERIKEKLAIMHTNMLKASAPPKEE